MAGGMPPSFKGLQHYLKTAAEHDKRDPVVSYYCRLYAMQKGMEIDRKSPDAKHFLSGLMSTLEESKSTNRDLEGIQNAIIGQAHVENYALKLFLYADNEDRAGRFGKNVVKSFYTAGMLMDVLGTFGELSEDIEKNQKYAKWKAAYIHNCLKNGEVPVSGPLPDEADMGDFDENNFGGSSAGAYPGPSYDQPSPAPRNGPSPNPQSYPPPQQPVVPPAASQYQPPPASYHQPPAASYSQPPGAAGGSYEVKSEDYSKAMKWCKFATSALQYEDAKTAIENLTKALNLLTTGRE